MDDLKEWIEVASKLILIIGGLIAAFKAISEMRRSREEAARTRTEAELNRHENERKLTWEKVRGGKELLDDMLTDKGAAAAMRMLDSSGRTYILPTGDAVTVDFHDLKSSLQLREGSWSEKTAYIRDSFDSFLRHLERIEHFIEVNLVEFPHITHPTRYYIKRMAREGREVFEDFMLEYDSPKAIAFCERFDEWKSA